MRTEFINNAIIPYVEEADYPDELLPVLGPYQERMGFIPNALKIYMHRPEICGPLWALNSKIMRDESSELDAFLKRRLAAVASHLNRSEYCVTHNTHMLKQAAGGSSEGWGMDQGEIDALLEGSFEPEDEFEAACLAFVKAASEDASAMTDEILDKLKNHLSPAQIVELACLVGFWKMYNTIHEALKIPIEEHLLRED